MNEFDPNKTIVRLPRRIHIVNAEQPRRDGSGYNEWERYNDLTLTPEIVHCPETGDRGRLLYRSEPMECRPSTLIDGAAMLRAGFVVAVVLTVTAWVW